MKPLLCGSLARAQMTKALVPGATLLLVPRDDTKHVAHDSDDGWGYKGSGGAPRAKLGPELPVEQWSRSTEGKTLTS